MTIQIIEHEVTLPTESATEPITVKLQLEVSLPDDCSCEARPVSLGNPRGWVA